jgi:hypothetical protein
LQAVEPPTLEREEESDKRVCASSTPRAAGDRLHSQQETVYREGEPANLCGISKVEISGQENRLSEANRKPGSPDPKNISGEEKPHARRTRRVMRQASGGARASAAPKERDANLDHPAVKAYREICHTTLNEVQRAEVVAVVGDDLETWKGILRKFMLEGQPKHRVDWTLERYNKAKPMVSEGAHPETHQHAERTQSMPGWLNMTEDQLRERLNQQMGGAG